MIETADAAAAEARAEEAEAVAGHVALVHGVTHYARGSSPGSTRYTDVWRYQRGRWLAVAAQLTAVV